MLSVDDFSFRRGVSFGTLLYDCERRQVVDLFEGRSADFLAQWLQAHPGVEVIVRDRAGCYADGARQGAADAVQVADRFHLLQNLGDCLERLAQRCPVRLPRETTPPPPAKPPTREELAKLSTRRRRAERRQAILDLLAQGLSQRAVARRLGLSRKTVRRYVHGIPDNAQAKRPSLLDPYSDYLRRRWEEGEQNARCLHQEFCQLGFTGSESLLRRRLRAWRTGDGEGRTPAGRRQQTIPPRRFRRLVLVGKRSQPEAELLARICAGSEVIARSVQLAEDFARAVREGDCDQLSAWLVQARSCAIPEWCAFAQRIDGDLEAVRNALRLPWSQGPIEGTINRMKTVKRDMYGRGKSDLLFARMRNHLPS